MDEELTKILSNAELDDTAKQEAIKSLVSKEYVPAKVHSAEVKKVKDSLTTVQTDFDTFKQQKMTDEEKRQAQELQKAEKEKSTNLLLSKMVAENIFSKAGFKEEEYKEIMETIVNEDYEKTQGFAEKLCKTMINQKQAIEQQVKKQITDGTPKPKDGEGGEGTLTGVEKYQKLYGEASANNNFSDMAYYQRLMLAEQSKK